jgi:hypothetical protein
MTLATIIMLAGIGLGCVLMLVGLAVFGHRAVALRRTARQAGIASTDQMRVIARRVRDLEPRIRGLTVKQQAVAARLKNRP